jgi:hypothetical protein
MCIHYTAHKTLCPGRVSSVSPVYLLTMTSLSTENFSGFHTTGCEQQIFFPNISGRGRSSCSFFSSFGFAFSNETLRLWSPTSPMIDVASVYDSEATYNIHKVCLLAMFVPLTASASPLILCIAKRLLLAFQGGYLLTVCLSSFAPSPIAETAL